MCGKIVLKWQLLKKTYGSDSSTHARLVKIKQVNPRYKTCYKTLVKTSSGHWRLSQRRGLNMRSRRFQYAKKFYWSILDKVLFRMTKLITTKYKILSVHHLHLFLSTFYNNIIKTKLGINIKIWYLHYLLQSLRYEDTPYKCVLHNVWRKSFKTSSSIYKCMVVKLTNKTWYSSCLNEHALFQSLKSLLSIPIVHIDRLT